MAERGLGRGRGRGRGRGTGASGAADGTRWRVIAGSHGGGPHVRLALGITDALGTTFESLGWTLAAVGARRRLGRLVREAGAAVSIAAVKSGVVRVEGTVEVLDAVFDEDGERVAAYVRRETRDLPCGCAESCTAVRRYADTYGEAGRFLVRDESGVAIVVGPRLRLLDYHGQPLDPFEPGRLVVRNGDEVTLVGDAALESTDEPRARVTKGYRGSQLTPVFRGRAGAPVHVFAPHAARR